MSLAPTGPRGRGLAVALLLVLAAALLLSLFVGSVRLTPREVLDALGGHGRPEVVSIVREIRLPRALLGLLVGGALALSGATLQALLQNPLADPYLLGVSGGAACGTLLSKVVDLDALLGPFAPPLAAFGGALGAVALVGLGASRRGRLDRARLLLSGVVVNAFASAVLLFLLSFGDTAKTRGFVFWMLGSLAGATTDVLGPLAAYVGLAVVVLLPLSSAFDALTLGDETAFSLGVNVERVKRVAYLTASLLAAAAVASAGIIGFVGLLVPHAVRRVSRGHRSLLLLSFVGGAALLLVSDAVARTVFAPDEISVGAVTALLGAPAFLVLLRRQA